MPSYGFRGGRRVMARQWCVHRNHWLSLLVESMHSVLCSCLYGHRSGSHTCGEKETNVAGWQMGTNCGLHRLLEIVVWSRRWKLYALRRHFVMFPCSSAFPVGREHSFEAGRRRLEKSMGRVSSLQTDTPVRKSTMV